MTVGPQKTRFKIEMQAIVSLLMPLLPILFFSLFYFYPLGAIFRLSFTGNGRSATAVYQLFSDPTTRHILWFTTWQALLSTVLTVLLALPGAYLFAHFQFRGKTTLKAILTLPFVLPTIVVANALTALLGSRGLLNTTLMALFHLPTPLIRLEHSIWLIFIAHIFYNYSVVLRMVSQYWQNLPSDLSQAAQMLGASPARAFWHITLPLLWPAIFGAALLVFIFTFTSFGVVLILGGPGFATLEVEIYRQAVNLFNLPLAAALSLWQILFTFGLTAVYTRLQSRLTRPLRLQSTHAVERPIRTPAQHFWVSLNLLGMAALLALPLWALVARSFEGKNGFTLAYYQELFINRRDSLFFVPPVTAVANSLTFAFTAMLLATSLGLLTALFLTQTNGRYRQWLDPLFMLPLSTSAVTLGFGYIIALNRPPLDLRSSSLLVPIAHTLIGIPFVIRAVLPALRRINPKLRETAVILGASPRRVWWEVDWPLIRRALLVGALFAFTVSMGEFGATLFIARPQTPTIPTAIYRFLSQPGDLNSGQAFAMSSLLLLVCAVGFMAIERFHLGDEGEF